MREDKLQIAHTNFLKAVNLIMVNEGLSSYHQFANWIDWHKQTIYSIEGGRMPTVEQIITVCEKGGFNANWILLNVGEPMMSEHNDIDKVMKELKAIKAKVSKLL